MASRGGLAVFAGVFLYIGAADLLPEALQHESPVVGIVTALGTPVMFAVTFLQDR